MSLHIAARSVEKAFAEVEGEEYVTDTYSCYVDSEVGLEQARKKHQEFVERRDETQQEEGLACEMLDAKGVAIIYGMGGMHRYRVRGDGLIEFSTRHASEKYVKKALKAGFDVY